MSIPDYNQLKIDLENSEKDIIEQQYEELVDNFNLHCNRLLQLGVALKVFDYSNPKKLFMYKNEAVEKFLILLKEKNYKIKKHHCFEEFIEFET